MNIYISFALFLLISSCSFGFLQPKDRKIEEKEIPVRIFFDIIQMEITACDSTRILANVKEFNQADSVLHLFSDPVALGTKLGGYNYIEVRDLNDNKVEAPVIHIGEIIDPITLLPYDYKEVFLKKGESRESEIDISPYISIRKLGIYKLRFVSVEYCESIFSNWDTLIVSGCD